MDYRYDRIKGYISYHNLMVSSGDCDPAYPALKYLSDRFELNDDQRLWLCWLYSTTYCVATAYYIFNEFPDYENVDIRRLQAWWDKNKPKLLFQTDCLKVKSFDMFVPMFESFKKIFGQYPLKRMYELAKYSPERNYQIIGKELQRCWNFGRWRVFLYTELMFELLDFPILCDNLELDDAESCRNGMLYVFGWEKLIDAKLTKVHYERLQIELTKLFNKVKTTLKDIPTTYWNVETTLCAYKKLFYGKRYFGYYIDRMMDEIIKMEKSITKGVDWSVLWDFRREYFNKQLLGEYNGWQGIRPKRHKLVLDTGNLAPDMVLNFKYKKAVEFPGSEQSYKNYSSITI